MNDPEGALAPGTEPVDTKVPVERQCFVQSDTLHQGKARAIDQTEVLIRP